MSDFAVLIATKDRLDLLAERSLPSVVRQTHRPPVVVVVNDGPRLTRSDRARLRACASSTGIEVVVLPNSRRPGAGGAWNTGIKWLSDQRGCEFVAIIDDDDAWDPEHLEANSSSASDVDITVSGLRMYLRGRYVKRPLIKDLSPRSFLVGNPGWQGSNTVVSLDLLLRVGGFREGLQSMNDRDLAFRLLSSPGATWRLVPRWTATWHADTPGNLSEPRSPQKLEGLRAFWALYGQEMSSEERCLYFQRALRLFGFEQAEIIRSPAASCPPMGFAKEALHD